MKRKFLLLTCFLQLFVSCSNEDNKNSSCEDNLPQITTIGVNTFGCCINDNLLIPRDGSGTLGGNDDGMSYFGGYPDITDYYELDIRDFKSDKTGKILIHMHQVHLNGIGNYIINESNGNHAIDGLNHTYLHCRVFDAKTNSYQYYRSFENSGLLKITRYDYANGIISGVFDCVIKNSSDNSDTIKIKQGRFDINGYTLPNISFP